LSEWLEQGEKKKEWNGANVEKVLGMYVDARCGEKLRLKVT
jgi:hypothetical protein